MIKDSSGQGAEELGEFGSSVCVHNLVILWAILGASWKHYDACMSCYAIHQVSQSRSPPSQENNGDESSIPNIWSFPRVTQSTET